MDPYRVSGIRRRIVEEADDVLPASGHPDTGQPRIGVEIENDLLEDVEAASMEQTRDEVSRHRRRVRRGF